MDCELCEKRMVDLLYDELEARAAAETREHLAGCESCKQAFDRLEAGRAFARRLELVPAPSLDKVLAAAREQAAAHRAARGLVAGSRDQPPTDPATRPTEAARDDGPVARFVRWLGAVAMGPQLGVATVLLLVVGIGLWYLPQLDGGGRGPADGVLEPEPIVTGETTLMPAEPLQLSHDPRTGRVVEVVGEESADESANAARGEGAGLPRRLEHSPEAPRDRTADLYTLEREVLAEQTVAGSVRDEPLPEVPSAAGAYEGGDLPPIASLAEAERPTPGASPTAAPSTAPVEPPATSPPSSIPLTAPSTAPRQESVPAVSGTEEPLAAHALHQQARSLAAAGRCQESVSRYEQLFSRYPDYAQSGQASLEAGQCLRRLGRTSSARVALQRAARSSVPMVASAARRELVELDAEDRRATEVPQAAEAAH